MSEEALNRVAVATVAAAAVSGCSSLGFLVRGDWKASAVAGWTAVGAFAAFVFVDGRAEAARRAERAAERMPR